MRRSAQPLRNPLESLALTAFVADAHDIAALAPATRVAFGPAGRKLRLDFIPCALAERQTSFPSQSITHSDIVPTLAQNIRFPFAPQLGFAAFESWEQANLAIHIDHLR